MKWQDLFPEVPVAQAGDPFVGDLIAFDDRLGDIDALVTFGALDDAVGRVQYAAVLADRLAYEITYLQRWWDGEGS